MTKIGDLLNAEDKARLAVRTINIGDVFFIPMTRDEGITPKDGDDYRNKFFVVLGFDGEGNAYGGVVINSGVNLKMPMHIQQMYMPVKCSDYTFLSHDSFVNCSTLHIVSVCKLTSDKYRGSMSDEHVQLIIGTVIESKTISKKTLKRFNLL